MPIYFGRLRLRNLTSPPPPFRTKRTSKARKKGAWNRLLKYYFGWIPHILLVDDRTLIATAGLDAFAFLRVCQFGLQLFVPLAVFAMIILLPVHVHGNDLELQHASFVASNVNVTAERPMGLLLTTVANIESKSEVLWLHVVGLWLVVLYATWLLRQHSETFVLLRTLYLTTRGDTNLWRVVHQPSNFVEQMLLQGTSAGAEIDNDELRKMKSANSDDINAACDALAAMDEIEEENGNIVSRTAKRLTRMTTMNANAERSEIQSEAVPAFMSAREVSSHIGDEPAPDVGRRRLTSPIGATQSSPFSRLSSRRVSFHVSPSQAQGNVVKTLKGEGALIPSPQSVESDARFTRATPPEASGPSTSGTGSTLTKPGPVTESKHFTSFTSGEGSEELDLSVNPPVSEPPNKEKRAERRKIRLGSFGSLGAMPASMSESIKAREAKESATVSDVKRVVSDDDFTKRTLMDGVMNPERSRPGGSSENMTWLVSPTKSPRRTKHVRAPTREDIPDVTLTPAVKKALQRVKFRENAGEAVVPGGTGSEGAQVRAETAITHDWWVGLDITKEYNPQSHQGVENEDADALRAPTNQEMDEAKRNLFADNQPEPLIDANSPVSRASIFAGEHLNDAPAAVPDVDCTRTVNAYDEKTKQIVSVWASSYTVLITNIPFVRVMNEEGKESVVRGLRQVDTTLEYIYGGEFRGLIPIFDHRPVDALLDSRDECKNSITKLRMQMARMGIMPSVNRQSVDAFKFDRGLTSLRMGDTRVVHEWTSFRKYFVDVLRPPKHLKKLEITEQIAVLETQLKAIEQTIVEVRKCTWEGSPGPCAFAVFENQFAASTAAQCIISRATHKVYRAFPAPGPDDVNWQTLLHTTYENRSRALTVWPLILLVMLFPTGMFATAVTSVCQVRQTDSRLGGGEFFDWYCSDDARVYAALISGVLPPVLLTLWEVFVISFYMLYLVQKQNAHVSLSATDRRFLRFYWAWGAVNVLIGGIFGGAISLFTTTLNDTVSVNDVQLQFGRVLPMSSNFFLLFIVFRAVYLPVQRLLIPHPGSFCLGAEVFWCEKRGKCARTSRDKTVLYSPRAVRMGREIGVFMLVMLIGLTFVCVAPIIPIACAVFYVTNFVIWRYHVLYVYERGYESNGAVWLTFSQLVLLSLLVAQTFLSCVLFSKEAYVQGAALYATVPYYLSRINRTIHNEFGSSASWGVPLSEATAAPPADFGGAIYTHPALRPAASGWHPDVGKVWKGYPGVCRKNTT